MADETPSTQDYDALRAEVAAEPETQAAELPAGIYAVPLADTAIRVKDLGDWPSSANEDLTAARFTRWARKVSYSDDDFLIWAKIDPTNKQVGAFLSDWEKISGLPLVSMLLSWSG